MPWKETYRFSSFAPGILRNFRRHIARKHYTKKLRDKKNNSPQSNVDIGGILSGSAGKPVDQTSTAGSSRDAVIRKWQISEERTALLRKGERRIAIVAVVTMIIGYVAIKLMVYVAVKRRTRHSSEEQPT